MNKSIQTFILLLIFGMTSQIAYSNHSNLSSPEDLNLTVTLDIYNVTCAGGSDGVVAAVPDGGLPPYTYLWNTGATSQIITGLIAGPYSVTVTDDAGATAVASGIVQKGYIIDVPTNANYETCDGSNDAEAAVFPEGGVQPYTYLWSDPAAQTTFTAVGLAAGTYTVTVTDANGCSNVASVTVELSPEGVWIMTSSTPTTCYNGNDGTAHVSIMTGTAPFTVVWDDPAMQTTTDPTGLAPGTYGVTVTDVNGCSAVGSVEVGQAPELVIVATSSSPADCGLLNGTATVEVSGGTPGYTYLWNDPAAQTTTTATGLGAGMYTVVATDSNGCSISAQVDVEQSSSNIILNIIGTTDASCNGGSDGTAQISISGGNSPYSILWDPTGQTAETATGLSAGTYLVVVSDANGCSNSISVTVGESSPITATLSSMGTACGAATGSATVVASGGTPPYTYLWNDPAGQTTATATGLGGGTYTVVVTDTNGCSKSFSVTISESSPITATLSSVGTGCDAAAGSATVVASGGTPPYTYLWSDPAGQTTATATGLAMGNYSVVVSDANGCSASFGPVLVEDYCPCTTPLISDLVVVESTCGNSTGSATIQMVGGNDGYTFVWTPNVSSSNAASGLAADAYTVVIADVTDAECTITETFTVGNADGPTPEFVSQTPATCNESNGTATLGPIGYQFLWCDGTVGNNAINLPAGPCAVTVTDPNTDCFNVITVDIEEYVPLSASAEVTNFPDCGVANGAATILVEMGSFDYTFNWSDGGSGESRTDLAAGTYTVTVIDNGPTGCVTTTTFTILNESVGTATITIVSDTVSVTCIGDADGTVEYDIQYSNDFVQPATVLISNGGGTIGDNGALEPGDYCIDVIDADGCFSTSKCFTVVQPEQIDLDIAILNADCDVPVPGSITITDIRGGNGSYVFDWADLDGNDNPMNRTDLGAGVYSLTVTDSKGCTVDVPGLQVIDDCDPCPPPVIASVVVVETPCGEDNGTATINMADGNENFTYAWSPGVSTTNSASGIASGAYSVTITRVAGDQCSIIEDFTVGSINGLDPEVESQTAATCGASDGSATLSPANYTYTWSNDGFVGATRNDLAEGTYTIEVSDPQDASCTDAITVVIFDENLISVEVVVNQTPICGNSNGSVTLDVTGGSGDYTYSWGGSPTQTNLSAGSQMVNVLDNITGCDIDVNFVLDEEVSEAFISVQPMVQTTCPGSADGSVDLLSISFEAGFIQPASIRIEDMDGDQYFNGQLAPGNYCVIIRDGNGCVAGSDCFRVENAPQIDVDIELFNQSCAGMGAITLVEVTGGNGGFEFDWLDLNIVEEPQNRDSLDASEYVVTVMDVEGCSVSQNIIIEDERYDLEVEIDANDISCNGYNDGTIILTPGAGVEPYSYNWNVDETEGSLVDLEQGTYEVTITDANECSIEEVIDISEPVAIDLDLGGDTLACASSLLIGINDNPDYTFSWTDENGMEIGNTSQISVVPAGTSTYVLSIVDGNQCSAVDSISVTGGELDAAFDFILDACSDIAEFSLTDQSSSDFDQIIEWNWTLSNGMTSELQNPSFSVDSAQTLGVELTISTAQGCMQTISEDFIVDPIDTAVPDATACMNVDEVELNELNANSTYIYSWEQDGTLSDPNIPNPISSATENTTYTVTITNSDETCEVMETVDLVFYETVDLTASGDQNVCSDMDVSLTAQSDNAITYEWSTDQGSVGQGSTISVESGPIGATQTYFVAAVDANGCEAFDTVLVANRSVIFELEDEEATICRDDNFTVFPIAGLNTENLSFEYFPPDIVSGETTIDSEPIIAPNESMSFLVEASNDFGCSTVDSIFIDVSFIEESVEASALPTEIIRGQESQLDVDHDGGLTFEWSNGETLDDDNAENPVATPLETTTYNVVVMNEDGCIDNRSVTVLVTIPDCDMPYVFVPNAFTPNQDGINDIFRIRGELYITDAFLVVYSRWGEKVFESSSIGGGWDGRFKGEDLGSDVYAFYYRVVCFNGQTLEGKGNVSLLR